MELPAVFLLDAGYMHSTPHLPLTCHGAQQHREELADIEPIGLGPALAPVNLNAGGVDDGVRHPMRDQGAVQPEAVAARLVTAHDAGVLRQAKALLRSRDLLLQGVECPSRDHPCAWRLRHADGETQFPLVLPQFKCQEQRGLGGEYLAQCGSCRVLSSSLLLLEDKVSEGA